MAFNGSGTYSLYATGNPVVTNTTISSTWANNTLDDIATGLTTCITKDGQTTTTVRIPFAAGINSTLSTDATTTATGSIITAGGVGIAKSIWVGTTLNVAAASTLTGVVAIGLAASATTWLNLAGATTAISSLRIAQGSGTPSSPVSGDIWADGTNLFFRNAAGATKTFAWV